MTEAAALVLGAAGAVAALAGFSVLPPGWLPRDPGGGRKLQARPVPLAGGPAVALGLTAAWAAGVLPGALFAAVLPAFALGFADDRARAGLPWWLKLAGQTALAVLAAALYLPSGARPAEVGVLVLSMNAWNLFDNHDGCAVMAGLVSALWLGGGAGGALAGALVPVLARNWPRARLYLGDSGSHLLGLATALLALRAAGPEAPFGALAAEALLQVDLAQVVAVRLAQRLPPWRADRRHLAHRLAPLVGHAAVAPLLAGLHAALLVFVVPPPGAG